MKDREGAFQRLSFKDHPTKTLRSITEERKKAMIEENMEKFGRISIGVHGIELPKFNVCDDTKQYWR